MSMTDRGRVIRLAEARLGIPGPAGEHAVLVLQHGTLDVKLSFPERPNQQRPHAQDEVYVVVLPLSMEDQLDLPELLSLLLPDLQVPQRPVKSNSVTITFTAEARCVKVFLADLDNAEQAFLTAADSQFVKVEIDPNLSSVAGEVRGWTSVTPSTMRIDAFDLTPAFPGDGMAVAATLCAKDPEDARRPQPLIANVLLSFGDRDPSSGGPVALLPLACSFDLTADDTPIPPGQLRSGGSGAAAGPDQTSLPVSNPPPGVGVTQPVGGGGIAIQ